MGKAQDGSKATQAAEAPKRTVSTSRIFKRPRKQPSRKGEPKHGKHAVKLSSRKGINRSKHKSKVEPDNPILTSWDDRIKTSSDLIEVETTKGVEATAQDLSHRFCQSDENNTQQFEADSKVDEILYLPLADEGMKYASHDGSQTTEGTTLGAQMKRFKKIVAKEEKELEFLMKQWALVQAELEAVASDILGPDWAKILPGLSEATIEKTLKDEDTKAFEMTNKRFEDMIQITSDQAVEKMVASEKEFKMKQQNKQLQLQKLFDEDEADEV